MEFKEIYVDEPINNSIELRNQIITLLSENDYSISEARGLFNGVIQTLERYMKIKND